MNTKSRQGNRTAGRDYKINIHNAGDRTLQLYSEGRNYSDIAKILTKEFPSASFNRYNVSSFIKHSIKELSSKFFRNDLSPEEATYYSKNELERLEEEVYELFMFLQRNFTFNRLELQALRQRKSAFLSKIHIAKTFCDCIASQQELKNQKINQMLLSFNKKLSTESRNKLKDFLEKLEAREGRMKESDEKYKEYKQGENELFRKVYGKKEE